MNIFLTVLPYILFFILGSIIGSFLNVVLFRYNTGKTLMGRSKCFSCKRTLTAIDLVPLLSYMVFGGRCRTCHSKISPQYFFVELFTGILFAGSYAIFASVAFSHPTQFAWQFFYTVLIMSLLVLIFVYDLRHKIIPDMFVFLFIGLSFATLFLGFDSFGALQFRVPSLVELTSGLILAFPFYFLWLVSDGRWMGFGDAKLALGFGWFLGLARGASAIILGFWIGAVVSLGLLLISGVSKKLQYKKIAGFVFPSLSMKSEIPFAPFLITGLLIVFFFGYTISMFQTFLYLL
jgi:leader peptidase (prepilin peptidase)/N-methyltransferase